MLRKYNVSICLVLLFVVLVGTVSMAEAKDYKVALVTSMGGLGDRSYNDSAYRGLQKAEKELGIEIKVVEPGDVSEGEKYLTMLAKLGYDLVMTLEYGHADILDKVADRFPTTKFAIFNIAVEKPNVVSVIFKEHEGSFLAGALAAMVTTDTTIPGVNKENVIGVIGGIDSPGINKFLVGYEEGAKYINPHIKVLKAYSNSFGDPAKGKELALVQMEKGADVVYQVAGGTGEGIIAAAEEKGCFAIGVDSDQDHIAPGHVLTSMLKRMDVAVYDLCKNLVTGELKGGTVMSPGLKEGGVGLSEMKYTKDIIPEEYLEKITKIKDKIISGEIKVTDITKK